MKPDVYSYEPAKGHGLRHDPIPSILAPRPIGWISSCSADGRRNLAPYSFFNVFNYKPPIVAFSSVGWKDTVRNVTETGEFVVNLAVRRLAEHVNLTSKPVRSDVDEFAIAHLTPSPCSLVSGPRVQESPVSLECRVIKVEQLHTLSGEKLETWMVMGEVIAVHIQAELIRDGSFDTVGAQPILRGGGAADYFEINEKCLFKLERPGASAR